MKRKLCDNIKLRKVITMKKGVLPVSMYRNLHGMNRLISECNKSIAYMHQNISRYLNSIKEIEDCERNKETKAELVQIRKDTIIMRMIAKKTALDCIDSFKDAYPDLWREYYDKLYNTSNVVNYVQRMTNDEVKGKAWYDKMYRPKKR